MRALQHYTCTIAARAIVTQGVIVPNPQPEMDMLPVVWLADYRIERRDTPTARQRLGLHNTLDHPQCRRPACDRVSAVIPVHLGAGPKLRHFSDLVRRYPRVAQMYAEMPGTATHRWWFCLVPIHVRNVDEHI